MFHTLAKHSISFQVTSNLFSSPALHFVPRQVFINSYNVHSFISTDPLAVEFGSGSIVTTVFDNYLISNMSLIVMRRVRSVFCFDLARVFLQGSTMPPLHPKLFFGIVIIVGRGHYASASTYARHFVRVPPCHPYTKFLGLSLWEWGIIRLLRLSQFISSGSHHATTTPCFLFF